MAQSSALFKPVPRRSWLASEEARKPGACLADAFAGKPAPTSTRPRQPWLMSTSRVSRRHSNPTTRLTPVISTGYHRP
ncbi:hypothetical protein DNK59_19330 [Pseudomonas sp. TKO26]|nr:hypothetical protein DNK62_19330 [Pseudomonas sp. TKO30]PYY85595.1 hypothetical protein DNK61_18710 [Pseudomonas sp. TKO29]PYY87778.1 hypothetical protein DNK59_19330 [Pseudomonas sp. TKO26]PYY98639.1 hypothetical protein DNK60_20180 [Pseudomonas sp. TKO14]